MAHLTRYDREKLAVLRQAGHTQEYISTIIGCSQGTISKELKRNSSPVRGKYTAKKADESSKKRRRDTTELIPHWYDDKELLSYVLLELKDGKTPDQISGRLRREGKKSVSHQTIYTYISDDKKKGGNLYKHLRYQGKKYKWRGIQDKEKTRIPNRRGIEERPGIVHTKQRYGDWETDLVVSKRKGSGALATFAERKSMYCSAIKIQKQSAEEMVRATTEIFSSLPKHLKRTMTHDNGKEISRHEEITEKLQIDVYCARPYKSCDRGLNEWMNRELRRFFPKGTDFAKVTQKQVDYAVTWLNNCPRKSLQYRTPKEVFDKQLQIIPLEL